MIHSKGKSFITEKFIRTLKSKIFKHMTAISKNVYFDVKDDIVNKYNNTIKMKLVDVKDNKYVDSMELYSKKEVFVVNKIKNTVPWTYVINDLNGKEITGTFYERELQKTN